MSNRAHVKYNKGYTTVLFFLLVINLCFAREPNTSNPNVVIIYADDLGYGDISCFNSDSKIQTPNMDRLAKEGLIFTDAHSASAVCSPSRYSLLTGRMEFRTGFEGVFSVAQDSCLIEKGRLTLPQMLRESGYATAMVGKWHIGMKFLNKDGEHVWTAAPFNGEKREREDIGFEQRRIMSIDFTKPISDGPVNRGFDYFFGTAACPTTAWLYAFIEGDRIPVPPTKIIDKSKLPKNPYTNDCRAGMIAPDYDMEEMDMIFLKKSQAYITNHVKNRPDQPFFLFHSAAAVHLPSLPSKSMQGKTKAGPHGDFIFEFDCVVGELVKTLEKNNVLNNTLVIVTSDNGPENVPVKYMRQHYHHDPAGAWRGKKRENWEGGHREPFVAYWPKRIKGGGVCEQPICQTDIMATLASIVGYDLPEHSAEDSFDFSEVFLTGNDVAKSLRPYILHQSYSLQLSVRKGKWKYLDHRGSGVIRKNRPESVDGPPGQLYDLENDPQETVNLYDQYPEIVRELKTILEETKNSGKSRI